MGRFGPLLAFNRPKWSELASFRRVFCHSWRASRRKLDVFLTHTRRPHGSTLARNDSGKPGGRGFATPPEMRLNIAPAGAARQREPAMSRITSTQIIWECKNYPDLKAGDFHQLNYYLNKNIGNFAIVSFRGDEWERSHYFQHIRRISEIHSGGMLIMLTDADL